MPVPPPAWPSTVVNPDKSITIRLNYPTAKQVGVATDALLENLAMTQGPDGVWTATTPPLAPEYYGNFVHLYSDILVPGTPPEP